MASNSNLSPEERAERHQILFEIRASSALEGGRSSDEAHALQDRWADGEITLDELHELIDELHPTTNRPDVMRGTAGEAEQ